MVVTDPAGRLVCGYEPHLLIRQEAPQPGLIRVDRLHHAASSALFRDVAMLRESDGDRIVPPASARLDDPRYGATNLLIPGCDHLTICRDARLIRSIVPELIRAEAFADLMAPPSLAFRHPGQMRCPAARHDHPAAQARQSPCHDEPCGFSGLMSGSRPVPGATR